MIYYRLSLTSLYMDYRIIISQLMTPNADLSEPVRALNLRAARAIATLHDLNTKNFDLIISSYNHIQSQADQLKEFRAKYDVDSAIFQYRNACNKDSDFIDYLDDNNEQLHST